MAIREEKEMKGMQIGKEEVKLSLFADDIIHTEKILKMRSELINESGKIERYKINIQEYFALLYTNIKRSEREIKAIILFTIETKRKNT